MFSLIYVWINGWVNNRDAGDLRRYRGHYDVNVMSQLCGFNFLVIPEPSELYFIYWVFTFTNKFDFEGIYSRAYQSSMIIIVRTGHHHQLRHRVFICIYIYIIIMYIITSTNLTIAHLGLKNHILQISTCDYICNKFQTGWLRTMSCAKQWSVRYAYIVYPQISNISRTLAGNIIVDHPDVVGALSVGAAQTTSSFST